MRAARRDKKKMYYALLTGRTQILDEDGNYTGDFDYKPANPVEFWACISPNTGDVSEQPFGASVLYSNTILTTETLPITEGTRLWVNAEPVFDDAGTVDFDSADYVVAEIAKAVHCTAYAIQTLSKDGTE